MVRSRRRAPRGGSTGRRAPLAPLVAALCAVAAGAGCREKAAAPQEAAAVRKAVQHYTVRGEVVALPQPGHPGSELAIRHEPIDDFVDQSGKVVGMDSMIMPFVVEPSISLAGIAVGDPVQLRFAVDWSRPAFWIEKLDKLPPDTRLHFGAAKPSHG